MPRRWAARARAAAWLPDEWVTTPRAAAASDRDCTALVAPRTLNAPTFWKFSHLKNTRAPARALTAEQVRTGVRWTNGRMRSWAARTSARVGGMEDLSAVSRDAKRSASRSRPGALHEGPRGTHVTRSASRRG